MRSLHIPMSIEEFHRMPWRFGWKHEYFGGEAHITPRHDHVHVRFCGKLPYSEPPAEVSIRPALPGDATELIEMFVEAFEDGVEFCDWTDDMINTDARRNIEDYFAGKRGQPMSESRLALEEGSFVGAVLFCCREGDAVLDLLMVSPEHRGRGVARALVAAAISSIRESGVGDAVRSAHHAANEESARWHRAFGFEEIPDLFLARMRRMFYLHEASRFPENSEEKLRLETLHEEWSRRAKKLEEIADREGYEAVVPSFRHR